jgi:hypothetical protein
MCDTKAGKNSNVDAMTKVTLNGGKATVEATEY